MINVKSGVRDKRDKQRGSDVIKLALIDDGCRLTRDGEVNSRRQ